MSDIAHQEQVPFPCGEMPADKVIELLNLFADQGIEVWVDGGWGVDALLGEQTRKHEDLDIALWHKDVPRLRGLLEDRGYRDVPRDDTRDCNFVLGDEQGHQVDVHSFTFDAAGNNVFGVAYLPAHLTGHGTIAGRPVKCIPPDYMVASHSGYALREKDFHDVKALCTRFSLSMPADFLRFTKSA